MFEFGAGGWWVGVEWGGCGCGVGRLCFVGKVVRRGIV